MRSDLAVIKIQQAIQRKQSPKSNNNGTKNRITNNGEKLKQYITKEGIKRDMKSVGKI